jgi:hypothetical protein
MALRNEAAQARIDTELATLAKGAGLELGDLPSVRRDPILQETLRLEWTADVLEAISAGGDSETAEEPARKSATKAKVED